MEIIALSGYARAGKDEAARALVEEEGFVQVAFADKLREMIYAINPIVVGEDGVDHSLKMSFLQDVIDEFGWNGYKDTEWSVEIRRLLQRLGTEAGRQVLWDSIWIDAAFANVPDDAKVVVSDARFFNEFDAVRDRGGYVWRIERPGVGPVSDHPSETEAPKYDKFSLRLENNGTLQQWRDLILNEYASKRFTEWVY